MAKCKICGEHYISKECPYCNLESYDQEENSKKKIIGKIKTNNRIIGRIENKEDNGKYIIYILIALIAIFIIYQITKPKNLLIGTWEPQRKTLFSTGRIEFTEDKEYFMGLVIDVKYKVEKDRVIINDQSGVGVVYKFIDENTMTQNLLGFGRIIYKRVE